MNVWDNLCTSEWFASLHTISKQSLKIKRKVVQIVATAEQGAGSDLLYALADDGTMWWIAPQSADSTWMRVKDIPQ